MKVLSIQTNIFWETPLKNFSNISKLTSLCGGSFDLIILPEMFNTGFSMNSSKIAEKPSGESLNWLIEFSKYQEAVVVASLAIVDNDKYYNRLYCVFPNGEVKYYNKRHLFRMAGENKFYESGIENITIQIKGFKIRPMICYDLRFPVWSRNRNNNEYDCLIYVANWPSARSLAWISLLQARAIENQAYVIGLNRVGIDGNGVNYSGDSRVFDFAGTRMDSFKTNKVQIQEFELDINALKEFREKFPSGMDADSFNIISSRE